MSMFATGDNKPMEHTGLTLVGELIGRVQASPGMQEGLSSANHGGDDTQPEFTALIDEINRVIAPPVAVSAHTVFVRAMEVLSDEVNDHGGRFATEEFPRLCELLIDSPVLVAHDKRQLPVARNFKAGVISRDGRPWIKVWFYWPKDASGAHDLAARIDSGVLREVSIGFEFKRPECSVCGADIRQCEHQPFAEIKHADGSIRKVHYIYRDIVRVLETSLVYRGATPGTRIGSGLFFDKARSVEADVDPPGRTAHNIYIHGLINRLFDTGLAGGVPIISPTEILAVEDSARRFIVLPLVEGLPVVAVKHDDEVLIFDADQHEFGAKVPHIRKELNRTMADDSGCFGWLVRSRLGKRKTEITLFADGISLLSDENHFGHLVIDNRHLLKRFFAHGGAVRPIPYRFVDREQLDRAIQLLSSSAGCRVYPGDAAICPSSSCYELRRQACFWLQIVGREAAPDGMWRYRLALADDDDFREISPAVISAQRYAVGQVVSVAGSWLDSPVRDLQMSDATIRYTPARRHSPDTVRDIRRMCNPSPHGVKVIS